MTEENIVTEQIDPEALSEIDAEIISDIILGILTEKHNRGIASFSFSIEVDIAFDPEEDEP